MGSDKKVDLTTVDREIFARLIFAAWRFRTEARIRVYVYLIFVYLMFARLIFSAQATGENFLTAKSSLSTVCNFSTQKSHTYCCICLQMSFMFRKRERALSAHCLLMCKVLLLPAYYKVTAYNVGLYSIWGILKRFWSQNQLRTTIDHDLMAQSLHCLQRPMCKAIHVWADGD